MGFWYTPAEGYPQEYHEMKSNQTLTTLSLLALATGLAIAEPDLIVSDITSATTFGAVDGKIAYSFGTTICNIGNSEAAWINGTNENPLISQTLYRLVDGQIQQIGIGFAHYTTPPLSGNACGLGCTPAGFNALGAGCSTTSSSTIHGLQSTLGPRTEINPFTGDYPYPFTSIGQTGDAIYKRLQVNIADISDSNALYFVETQVITSAETTPATRANNVSYRQVTFTPGSATASVVGPTYTEQPAIFAWRDHGNGIGMPDAGVLIVEATIPMDGIIHVGSKATDLGEGSLWKYTYAIHNQNSSQELGWIEHSTGHKGEAHSFDFNGVEYHDDIDGLISASDWTRYLAVCDTLVNWYAQGFPVDPFANGIRWGTTYGFSFITSSEPKNELFYGMSVGYDTAAGSNGDPYFLYDIDAISPLQGEFCNDCLPDLNDDGSLDFFDVSVFLADFAAGGDYNGDGETNFFDISFFLSDFNAGCP